MGAETDAAMKVAFCLSGGANLGPMQAGSVLALVERGIEPDLLVGSSVGALNAAFLSARPGLDGARELCQAWSDLRRRHAFRFHPLGILAGFLGLRDSLVHHDQFHQLIRRWIPMALIEEAKVDLAVVTTDALNGEPVVLREGDVVEALAASSAIPGILPPVSVRGRWLIDGSLAASIPVLQAQDLGAADIYVITTTTAPRTRPPTGAVATAMNSVSLLTARMGREQLAMAAERAAWGGGRVRLVPSSEPVAPGPFDFSRSAELIRSSYERARAWLEAELGT